MSVALTLIWLAFEIDAQLEQGPLTQEPLGYRILLVGNSHSSRNDLPDLVAALIRLGQPGATAYAEAAPRWAYLVDRLDDGVTQKALDAQPWTHVVLQAQKYSTSGRYDYPTDAAEEWIRRVRKRGATPILFPEWARRGNAEEGPRIQKLHLSIASREPACVAPVDFAWHIVHRADPSLRLHARDGNHSNRNGALLTAYVLYQAITRDPASELPGLAKTKVDTKLQDLMRHAETEAYRSFPGCPDTR